MSGWFELDTPAGRLRRFQPSQPIIDGLEPVADWPTGPVEWTLDGQPVAEERAMAILAAMSEEAGGG